MRTADRPRQGVQAPRLTRPAPIAPAPTRVRGFRGARTEPTGIVGTMEEQIRKIVREEIARALSAAGEVAGNADTYDTDHIEAVSLMSISRTMQRVARDVLANQHPEIPGHAVREDEHTSSTPPKVCTCGHAWRDHGTHRGAGCIWCACAREHASTEPVHTITDVPARSGRASMAPPNRDMVIPKRGEPVVPERPKATCTCHRHTHVMGHDDHCGSAFCFCLSPVRAQPEHTSSTDVPRTCSVCEHGEHDQGKCTMHVYLRGVASPCPCLALRTLGAQPSTRPNPMCTVCEHAPHGTGNCPGIVAAGTQFAAPCKCGGIEA